MTLSPLTVSADQIMSGCRRCSVFLLTSPVGSAQRVRNLDDGVIDRLKAELQRLRAAPGLSGIDADQLLTDLRSIAGEPDETAESLQELQTEHELRELKRRLKAEP